MEKPAKEDAETHAPLLKMETTGPILNAEATGTSLIEKAKSEPLSHVKRVPPPPLPNNGMLALAANNIAPPSGESEATALLHLLQNFAHKQQLSRLPAQTRKRPFSTIMQEPGGVNKGKLQVSVNTLRGAMSITKKSDRPTPPSSSLSPHPHLVLPQNHPLEMLQHFPQLDASRQV
jgi:hypothetical protein